MRFKEEERLRHLSRLGDDQATWELARVDERRGALLDEPIDYESGPETFTMFFLRGLQESVLSMNGRWEQGEIFPWHLNNGCVVGLQLGSPEMRITVENFLRGTLQRQMLGLLAQRPDRGWPAQFGYPWRPSPSREKEAFDGLHPDHDMQLHGIRWARDWSNVRAEYMSALFFALDELNQTGVRHTCRRWDALTLWLDIK